MGFSLPAMPVFRSIPALDVHPVMEVFAPFAERHASFLAEINRVHRAHPALVPASVVSTWQRYGVSCLEGLNNLRMTQIICGGWSSASHSARSAAERRWGLSHGTANGLQRRAGLRAQHRYH